MYKLSSVQQRVRLIVQKFSHCYSYTQHKDRKTPLYITLTVILGCVWRLAVHFQVGSQYPQYTAIKQTVELCYHLHTHTGLTLVSTSVHSMLLSHELLLVSLRLELELLADACFVWALFASRIDLLGSSRGVLGFECFKTSTSVNWTAVPPPRVR